MSDQPGLARRVDPDLINAWGIVPGEGGFWIAAEGTGKVAIYDGDGNPAMGEYRSGAITLEPGITGVAKIENELFQIHSGDECGAAEFIFASVTGRLIAFSDQVNETGGVVVVDRAGSAVYTGVAVAGNFVLAADFPGRKIDIFDTKFALVRELPGGTFTDPNLPADYGPFNVMTLGDHVFVTYAQIDPEEGEEVAGPGLGIVDLYSLDGRLLRRIGEGGDLNAPWGMAIAPSSFGDHADQLLVGNFGDGRISTFDLELHRPMGLLTDAMAAPIAIDGLWGITFGDDDEAGSSSVLYFAAGPDDELHGLFGRIELSKK